MIQETPSVVPRLTTALTGPLQELERHILTHQGEIERWFRAQWLRTPAPIYASPAVANGKIYLKGVKFLYCIGE